jgi:cytoskeletal protein CcmA (bactofilin family)
MKLIKKQLVTAILASTFSLGAHAVGINFDGASDEYFASKIDNCDLVLPLTTSDSIVYTCYSSPSTFQDDVYISPGVTVFMGTGGTLILKAASAILGVGATLKGNLDSHSTVVLGAGATVEGKNGIVVAATGTPPATNHQHNGVNTYATEGIYSIHALSTIALGDGATVDGNVYAQSTVAVGANATVIGNVKATTTIAVGANGEVRNGNVNAGTTFALGAGGIVSGTVTAGTTVALGANSQVNETSEITPSGEVVAGTTVALGAGSSVAGNVTSTRSTVTLGVGAHIKGVTSAASAATLGADAYTCGNVTAVTATLGAGAYVDGNVVAVTSTLSAKAFVTGNLGTGTGGTGLFINGITATLGADACFGSVNVHTLTLGAGAGYCENTAATKITDIPDDVPHATPDC